MVSFPVLAETYTLILHQLGNRYAHASTKCPQARRFDWFVDMQFQRRLQRPNGPFTAECVPTVLQASPTSRAAARPRTTIEAAWRSPEMKYLSVRIAALTCWSLVHVPLMAESPRRLMVDGLPHAQPEDAGMSSERLGRIAGVMQGYIDRGEIPGAITLVAPAGQDRSPADTRSQRHRRAGADVCRQRLSHGVDDQAHRQRGR